MSPSFTQVAKLRREIAKSIPWRTGDRQMITARRSQAFAEAMRERGWLAEEGYAK